MKGDKLDTQPSPRRRRLHSVLTKSQTSVFHLKPALPSLFFCTGRRRERDAVAARRKDIKGGSREERKARRKRTEKQKSEQRVKERAKQHNVGSKRELEIFTDAASARVSSARVASARRSEDTVKETVTRGRRRNEQKKGRGKNQVKTKGRKKHLQKKKKLGMRSRKASYILLSRSRL